MTVSANNDSPEIVDPALEKVRHAERLMSQAGFDSAEIKESSLLGARSLGEFHLQPGDQTGGRVSRQLAEEARAEGRVADAEIHYLEAVREDRDQRPGVVLAVAELHLQGGEAARGVRALIRATEEQSVLASASSQLALMAHDGQHRAAALALLSYAQSGMVNSLRRETAALMRLPMRKVIQRSREESDGQTLFLAACRFYVTGMYREAYYFFLGASERCHPLATRGLAAVARWVVIPENPREHGRRVQLRAERQASSTEWLEQQESRLVETAQNEPPVLSIAPTGDKRINGNDLEGLVAAANDGDRAALNRVLAIIRPLVVRYCRARVGRQERSSASADDVAQEVCLAVLTALPGYRDQGSPFLAFVYGIASHKVIDTHRMAARSKSEPVGEPPEEQLNPHDGPEQRALNGALAAQMGKLLDTLPPKQREILVLRVVVGLSAEETAEAVESTPGAVRVAQHRALSKLRTMLSAISEEVP